MEISAYGFVMFVVFNFINHMNCMSSTKLPELLMIDDSSREILFLDLYKRVSALEARTQMSDAVDWTQQTQFDALTNLAENQQEWLKNLDKLLNSNVRCEASKPARKKAAFSASLDHDIDTTRAEDVIFNTVILNEGGYYNPSTGVFTCPWNGVYDISFFVGQRTDDKSPKGVWANLKVNDKTIAMGVVDVYSKHQDLQGGNRVLVRLEEGDKVVVTVSEGKSHIEGTSHAASTFSAVYLFD